MSEFYAYARGYYDGRTFGLEQNPWDSNSNPELYATYRDGYDRGVSDYCREEHPEDEEV